MKPKILQDIDQNKQDISKLNSDLTTYVTEYATQQKYNDTRLKAVGGALPAYPTLVALQTAFPTGNSNFYVVSADSKWYYWNGTVWVSGGTYQSTGISDGSITAKKTVFAKNKNLFDGAYAIGKALTGSTEFTYTSLANCICAVIKVDKLKTYTISRSNDCNRFGVSTFIGEPTVNQLNSRRILFSVTTDTEVTVTMAGNEDYIVVYVSNENKPPSQLQVEEGAVKTEYDTYAKVIVELAKKSVKQAHIDYSGLQNTITPEMTTFAHYGGRNKFSGVYIGNLALTGEQKNGYKLSNIAGAKGVIFKGEKLKSYTITRSNDTDRDGIATFITNPTYDSVPNRVINQQVNVWSKYTITLQGDEEYIFLYLSSATESKEPSWLQIEEGIYASNYSPVNAIVIDNIETEPVYDNINYSNGSIAWFGDSISEFRLLPHRVGDLLNYTVYDCSFAGSVMSYNGDANYRALGFKELVGAIDSNNFTVQQAAVDAIKASGGSDKQPNLDTLKAIDWQTIDIVIVLYGTNDYSNSIEIGTGSDISAITEFKSCMMYAIEKLLTKYPHLKIRFITPTWRNDGNVANSKGYKLSDYCTAIIDVAKGYGIPSYDLYNNCEINAITKALYLNADYLHQSEAGDVLLADKIAKYLMHT